MVPEGEAGYLDLYVQSQHRLDGLPMTIGQSYLLNLPNIFSLKGIVDTPSTPLQAVATKADIGGIGGHVEVDPEVKALCAKYMLIHNLDKGTGKRIFRSMVVTHTGDDVCITIIQDADVPATTTQQLMDNALRYGGTPKAFELGLYGPGQDLLTDAFTGNVHGSGVASVTLPLPVREDPKRASQTVLVACADKTDPAALGNWLCRAYFDPNYNTGLLIAASAMKQGYDFVVADLDTRAQAQESGLQDPAAIDAFMKNASTHERVIVVSNPIDLQRLLLDQNRFVVAQIRTKSGNIGFTLSAERLHNISGTYSGKDDPVVLALCQGDWPAPGEISSVYMRPKIVAGDCRGSHRMYIRPQPLNSPTSMWSGPIVTTMLLSVNIHSGRIGALTDHFAQGTAWDTVRTNVDNLSIAMRDHGATEPATLPVNELEYQPGYREGMAELAPKFVEVGAGDLNSFAR
jgi:fructose 1,6-bisphosphate aldolase/phosphatase